MILRMLDVLIFLSFSFGRVKKNFKTTRKIIAQVERTLPNFSTDDIASDFSFIHFIIKEEVDTRACKKKKNDNLFLFLSFVSHQTYNKTFYIFIIDYSPPTFNIKLQEELWSISL